MRSKDHHLKKRGAKWYLRYDIPGDLRDCFPSQPIRGIEEALKTSDKPLARKLRDQRLGELEGQWAAIRRQLRQSGSAPIRSADGIDSYETWALQIRRDAADFDNFETALGVSLDRAEERDDSQEARRIYRAMEIAQGEATPIKEIADEYLATIQHLNSSTLSTRRKAIAALLDQFQTIEEVDKRKARVFLSDLMNGEDAISRRTVNQYCQAYRGVWAHLGLEKSLWSLEGLGSSVDTIQIKPWTDEDYLALLKAAEDRGERDMVLAIRIAAHTGAATQGVASAKLLDEETGKPSIYLKETKKDHRSRKIPCHPAILEDVREWMSDGGLRSTKSRHDERSLSRKFGRLKEAAGYGRDKVFHSFRHAVTSKLDHARAYDREIKRLLGHHIPDITFGTYSAQGLGYDALNEVVRKIEWPQPRTRCARRPGGRE